MKQKTTHAIAQWVVVFVVYSLLGAVCETLFRFFLDHRLYGIHGFLHHLPIMPIYGLGAIFVLGVLKPRTNNGTVLFVASVLSASILEFGAHWLIETIFGVRIWDYSGEPFSLAGRISLLHSVLFGVGSLTLVYAVHPVVTKVLNKVPRKIIMGLALIISLAVVTDTIVSSVQRLQ